jgi:hypothetical protein
VNGAMSDTDHPKCHADLKALAKKLRRNLQTLHALTARNDPWMVGQDFRREPAHWFKELYDRLKISAGIHIRRVFYLLVSQPDLVRLNGERFENTDECANHLGDAVRDARYLGLIEVDAFIDRKNPEPTINLGDGGVDSAAEIDTVAGSIERHEFGIDYVAPTLTLPETILLSEPQIGQRYHLEIWIEKSTANDVLLPLGREYGINIVTFTGEVSVTACKNLVDRAIASGRPVRIFHITDFDPAGRSMPVAAARKIEFYARKSGVDLDIRFEHVALTYDQCIEFELPRTPIKEKEIRGTNFEAQFGEGQTELDALQALHPGALREILVEHIERYYDHDLDDEVSDAVERFESEIAQTATDLREIYSDEIASFDEQRNAITLAFERVHEPAQAAYREAITRAHDTYTAAIEGARDEIMELQQRFIDEAEPLIEDMAAWLTEAAPDPELFDWPEPTEAEEWDDDPLYDSTRGYVEQVDRFREFQGKDSDVRPVRDRLITKTCKLPECGKPFLTAEANKKIYCSERCLYKNAYQVRLERKRQTNKRVPGQKG